MQVKLLSHPLLQKIQAIAAKPKEKTLDKTPEEIRADEIAAFKKQTKKPNYVTGIWGCINILNWKLCAT